jgi:hypothetical protein
LLDFSICFVMAVGLVGIQGCAQTCLAGEAGKNSTSRFFGSCNPIRIRVGARHGPPPGSSPEGSFGRQGEGFGPQGGAPVLGFFLGFGGSGPQSRPSVSSEDNAQIAAEAEEALRKGQYTKAIENLQKLERIAPGIAEIHTEPQSPG